MIQMVDLKSQYLKIKDEVDYAIQNVLDTTVFINGPQVKEFADDLAAYLDVKSVIPCANGTDALQIALMALNLSPGDEIIVPAFTYVATAEVIKLLGFKPVMTEVCANTFNVTAEIIEKAITSKTKAIVPVHLYGQCCNMEQILKVAKKHKLYVIEDVAQALGSKYTFSDGSIKRAGTMGDIGCTSFFPSKNLGCFGDGGAIYTNNKKIAETIKMIANHGQAKKYHHQIIGCNSRLDTIQAAILSVKLRQLDYYELARNKVADKYDAGLAKLDWLTVPIRMSNSTHVFHQYTLKMKIAEDRDRLKEHLANNGIPSMVYYPVALHLQEAFKTPEYSNGAFPIAEDLCTRVLSLPIHTEMEEKEINFIIETIKLFKYS